MMAQTLNLMPSLRLHQVEKPAIRRVEAAGKHKVLPNKQSQFIAQVIKC